MVGFALIALGEWVCRKVNPLSAVGLFGAGVAILFVVSYAGYGYYGLYGPNGAFVCMALSTVIGTLVARRGWMVSIAVLSMIGGNLAPAVLGNGPPISLLSYLLLLQITSLALAAWGAEPKWWTLRGLSIATTSLWVLAVFRIAPLQTVQLFIVMYAALYHMELIFSAKRSRLNAAFAGVTFSLLVTAAVTAGELFLQPDAAERLLFVLGLAGVAGFLAGACFTAGKKSAMLRAVAGGYAIQCLGLVVVSVPIALSGIWIAAAWGGMALCLAMAGWLVNLNTARGAAAAVWALSVGALVLWMCDSPGNVRQTAFTLMGADIARYAAMAWSLAIAGQLIATLILRSRAGGVPDGVCQLARTLSIAGSALWTVTALMALPMSGATLALIALSWILMAAGLLDDELDLRLQAAALLAVAAVKWAIADTLMNRLQPGWHAGDQLPLLTPTFGLAVLLASSFYLLNRVCRGASGLLAALLEMIPASLAAVLVLTWAGSFEIDREVERFIPAGSLGLHAMQWKQLLLTGWWMICCCGYLLAMHRRGNRSRAALQQIWGLPVLIAVKFILVDLLLSRVFYGPAVSPVLTGPVQITGAVVLAGLTLLHWMTNHPGAGGIVPASARNWQAAMIVAVLLCLGSLSIDQTFINQRLTHSRVFADPARAGEVATSIFWSVFALVSVAAGFGWRTAGLRYFGLALFAVTLLKVVTVDLSDVSTGYRILSFIGLGALLLGTSVIYGKVSPMLLSEAADPRRETGAIWAMKE
jgi:hypothetical protein